MSSAVIMSILGFVGKVGLAGSVVGWLVSKLPIVNVTTKSVVLNNILNALGNAAESVVKAVLNPSDIQALVASLSSGQNFGVVLSGMLPKIIDEVKGVLGPAMTAALSKLLGGDDAVANAITKAVLAAAHDVATTHKAMGSVGGQVAKLQDGHLLVVPNGQSLPAGASLVK